MARTTGKDLNLNDKNLSIKFNHLTWIADVIASLEK